LTNCRLFSEGLRSVQFIRLLVAALSNDNLNDRAQH